MKNMKGIKGMIMEDMIMQRKHMVTAMPVILAMAIAMQMIAVIPAAPMPAMGIATVTQKIAMILAAQIPAMATAIAIAIAARRQLKSALASPLSPTALADPSVKLASPRPSRRGRYRSIRICN